MDNKKLDPTKEKQLANYFYEMNNDGNDGWTKKHYKELYDKTLIEIEREKYEHKKKLLGGGPL